MAASRSSVRLLICSTLLMLLCEPAWALKLDGLKPDKTFRIDKIVFNGNRALPDSELLSHMTTKARPFYLFWQKRPEFDPDVFTEDLKRLALLYQTHGYFQAHLDYDLKVDGDL
jgi:outer membrane protein assembly factor BamA